MDACIWNPEEAVHLLLLRQVAAILLFNVVDDRIPAVRMRKRTVKVDGRMY